MKNQKDFIESGVFGRVWRRTWNTTYFKPKYKPNVHNQFPHVSSITNDFGIEKRVPLYPIRFHSCKKRIVMRFTHLPISIGWLFWLVWIRESELVCDLSPSVEGVLIWHGMWRMWVGVSFRKFNIQTGNMFRGCAYGLTINVRIRAFKGYLLVHHHSRRGQIKCTVISPFVTSYSPQGGASALF